MSANIWHQLGERFGLVSLRPKLVEGVRQRRVGGYVELVAVPTGARIEVDEEQAEVAASFDGSRTIAEMIVAGIGSQGMLAIDSVLQLVDRLLKAGMLLDFPPNLFRQLEAHLAKRAIEIARAAAAAAELTPADGTTAVSSFEQLPWRPKTPLLAERAQFLRAVPLFANLDLPTLGALAEMAHDETFPAASNVIVKGQQSERFYIIRSGEANVLQDDEQEGSFRRVARLSAGDYFGETALLDEVVRTATVRAGPSRPLVTFSFDATTFERVISPHIPEFRGRKVIARRRARLEVIPLFAGLSGEELERLSMAVREHHIPEDTVLFRQGDDGDRLYVIIEGEVRVDRDGTPVATLMPGEFFGETALLFTEQRTATVTTVTDSLLWSIDKVAFQKFLRESIMHRRELMPTLLNRLHSVG